MRLRSTILALSCALSVSPAWGGEPAAAAGPPSTCAPERQRTADLREWRKQAKAVKGDPERQRQLLAEIDLNWQRALADAESDDLSCGAAAPPHLAGVDLFMVDLTPASSEDAVIQIRYSFCPDAAGKFRARAVLTQVLEAIGPDRWCLTGERLTAFPGSLDQEPPPLVFDFINLTHETHKTIVATRIVHGPGAAGEMVRSKALEYFDVVDNELTMRAAFVVESTNEIRTPPGTITSNGEVRFEGGFPREIVYTVATEVVLQTCADRPGGKCPPEVERTTTRYRLDDRLYAPAD